MKSLLVIVTLTVSASLFVFAQRPNKLPNAQRPNANRKTGNSNSDSTEVEVADAKKSSDSASIVLNEGALLVSTIEGFDTGRRRAHAGATAQQVASYIASHAGARYSPAGCVTTSLNGTTVTINYDLCTGPHGLRQVTGRMVEDVSLGAGGTIDIHTTANGLQLGQTTMNIDSSSVGSAANGVRSMSVTTNGSGTGPLGNSITRQGSYTITWDTTCLTINGSWSSTSGDRARSTVKSISRCNQQCPSGTITHNYSGGRTLTIVFDGSSVAKWTSSTGKSGTINLVCSP